jgi:excinuclease ABC subunit C
VEDLEKQLWLSRPPVRVECFDVSNFGATDVVGSLVVFVDGEPEKNAYRRFRLRGGSPDDPSRMAELVRRRYQRKGPLPDLVVVDGGATQLAAARAELAALGLGDVEVVGLAKERRSEGEAEKPERVYLPDRAQPVPLAERSPGLHLLQRIRDEAHRFAVAYHRKLRKARTLKTGLEEVPGIGPRRRKGLLSRFKSLAKLKEATVEELAQAPSMTQQAARTLWQFLHEEGGPREPTP